MAGKGGKTVTEAISGLADFAEHEVREIILEVCTGAIFDTPVGNPSLWKRPKVPPGYTGGRARGNWQASIAAPITSASADIDPNGVKTLSAAQQVIEKLELGQRFYLSNNVPYIRRLEYGAHSQQAPQGMLRRSIQRVSRNIGR